MLRRLPGLLAADDPDARAPEHVVEAAWRLAATLTRDDAIGILVAESLPRGALDLVEYAFRSSASLGDGLERLARYGRVLSDRVAARTEANDEALLLARTRCRAHTPPSRPHGVRARHRHEARSRRHRARTSSRGGSASRTRLPPTTMSTAASSGPACASAPAATPCCCTHATPGGRCRTPTKPWPPSSGAGSNGCWRCRMPVRRGPLSARVRRVLVESLGRTSVTPDTMAESLGTTRRTLSRRLAAEGTSFRELHDDVRSEFARVMLGDRGSSVADVAFFLDYSEPAAFHRAFRRWTGQTPRPVPGRVSPRKGRATPRAGVPTILPHDVPRDRQVADERVRFRA